MALVQTTVSSDAEPITKESFEKSVADFKAKKGRVDKKAENKADKEPTKVTDINVKKEPVKIKLANDGKTTPETKAFIKEYFLKFPELIKNKEEHIKFFADIDIKDIQNLISEFLPEVETEEIKADKNQIVNLFFDFIKIDKNLEPFNLRAEQLKRQAELEEADRKEKEYKEYLIKQMDKMRNYITGLRTKADKEGKLKQGQLFPEYFKKNKIHKEIWGGEYNSKGDKNILKFEVVYDPSNRDCLRLKGGEYSLNELIFLACNFDGYIQELKDFK